MSEELIKKSDAIKVLEPFERNVDMMIDWFAKTYVKEVINGIRDGIKTIEPKKGKWILHPDDLFPAESTMECSVCHEHEFFGLCNENFCPNCGARMRGADDE